MKLIVGLGNPGEAYAGSRHNIGFNVVKRLAKLCRITLKRESRVLSLSGEGEIEGQEVVLALPLTFMNLSGSAVALLLKKYKAAPEDLLVICDDLELELGRIKIRPKGSSGGHRGLSSIIDSLGSNEFCRLRLGISRPEGRVDPADYVLSAFAAKEKKEANEMVEKALACSLSWASSGINQAMDVFNKRSQDE
jgi:peptidyl-tRNA hydrolase, PTH1 family